MIETIDLLVVCLGAMVIGMLYLLYYSDRNTTLFKNMINKPNIHYKHSQEPELLSSILDSLQHLSINEKTIVIQRLWGRPIKLITCHDNDGSEWFDTIIPFDPEEYEHHALTKTERSYVG